VAMQRIGRRAQSTQSAEPKVTTIAARVSRLWPRRSGGRRSSPRSPDVGGEQRLVTLEARMEHLEAALEGLENALYRQAVREDENIGELRRRTEPERMARDLSQDARKRGL
jgi:uncharacterized coiled-coil protein SlyX